MIINYLEYHYLDHMYLLNCYQDPSVFICKTKLLKRKHKRYDKLI